MAVQIAVVAAQVALPFLKKHPWIIPVAIVVPLVAVILIFTLIMGLIGAVASIAIPSAANCPDGSTQTITDTVPSQLNGIKDLDSLVTACPQTPVYGAGNFVVPSNGQIADFFGKRDIQGAFNGMHYGLDFMGSGSDGNIYATGDGTLHIDSSCNMWIDHGNGIASRYLHMDDGGIIVADGSVVKKGQQIGIMGNSCGSQGRHLHFQIEIGGERVDPLLFMLQSGLNIAWINKVFEPGVSSTTMYAYCDIPEGKYFYWCPGFDETKLSPVIIPPAGGDPKAYAQQAIQSRGWNVSSEFPCLDNLWTKESGWRVDALNASSGAYGIPQALPGDKMASAGADWQTNPNTQINWGLDYIQGRYGTPCVAWQHSVDNNWY
jgi:hypothetical protein